MMGSAITTKLVRHMVGVRLRTDVIRPAIAPWGSIVNGTVPACFEWNARRFMSVRLGSFAVPMDFVSYWRSASPIMIVLSVKRAAHKGRVRQRPRVNTTCRIVRPV